MTEWHLPDDVAATFAVAPRGLDEMTAASAEQHLASCARCRAAVADAAARPDLDALWAEVEDQVDQMQPGVVAALARRLRGAPTFQVVFGTRGLQVSALVAVALLIGAATLVANAFDAIGVYLVLAPVIPAALVAASFAPGLDPAGEAGMATPLYGIGLLMWRALAVEIASVALLTVGAVVLPGSGPRAMAWLLPSLALSAVTIAGGRRWRAPQVGAWAIGSWAGLVVVARSLERGGGIANSFLFEPAGQVAAAAVLAAAASAIVVYRHDVYQEVC